MFFFMPVVPPVRGLILSSVADHLCKMTLQRNQYFVAPPVRGLIPSNLEHLIYVSAAKSIAS